MISNFSHEEFQNKKNNWYLRKNEEIVTFEVSLPWIYTLLGVNADRKPKTAGE